MPNPHQATQLAQTLARLRTLHSTALTRASQPPRLPEGAWLGPAAANYEVLADQLASALRRASDVLGEACDDIATELARAVS